MDRTTLTRSLDILIKQKLIKNIRSTDARERIVQLTTQGHVVLDQAIPLWKEAEEEIFDECKSMVFQLFSKRLRATKVFLISCDLFGGFANLTLYFQKMAFLKYLKDY